MGYLKHDSCSLYYEVVGEGTPIVMHNGFGNSIQDFYELGYVAALSPYYQLILLDGRGFGKSSKPHAVDSYSFQKRCDDTIAVMDECGIDQAIAWGSSMGGRMVYALMHYMPDRFTAFIAGGMHPYAERTDLGLTLEKLLGQGMEKFVSDFERLVEPFPYHLRERYVQNDPLALSAVLAAYRQPLMDFSVDLAQITQPVLLYAGSEDPVREKMKTAAAIVQTGEFFIADNQTHCQVFWYPERVCELTLAFLKRYQLE